MLTKFLMAKAGKLCMDLAKKEIDKRGGIEQIAGELAEKVKPVAGQLAEKVKEKCCEAGQTTGEIADKVKSEIQRIRE